RKGSRPAGAPIGLTYHPFVPPLAVGTGPVLRSPCLNRAHPRKPEADQGHRQPHLPTTHGTPPHASPGGRRPAIWVSTIVASLGRKHKSRGRRRRQLFTALPRPKREDYLLRTPFLTRSVVAAAP